VEGGGVMKMEVDGGRYEGRWGQVGEVEGGMRKGGGRWGRWGRWREV
jgi:hypothetical protein